MEPIAWMALKDRFNLWTECDVQFANSRYIPNATRAFLIVQPVGLDTDLSAISYGCGSEFRGVLNVSAMVPTTWDMAQHMGMLRRALNLFPAGLRASYLDNHVEVYRDGKIIGTPSLDAGHLRLEGQVWWKSWG